MKNLIVLAALALSAGLAACGSDEPAPTGFPKPAGTIAVSITVDDTANKSYTTDELAWKGAHTWDATTRVATADDTWSGPFPNLYDDGPWTSGGHEPAGAVAGDHKWGVTIFIKPDTAAAKTIGYGMQDNLTQGWIWVGPNGSYVVNANATADITADGMTIKKFGTTDVELKFNKAQINTTGTWDTSKVYVKGSAWGWTDVELLDDGANGDATAADGIFTFRLSNVVGKGNLKHAGLLATGDKPEFVFEFGATKKEYKDASSNVLSDGVTAGTKASGASSYTAATIQVNATNKNTYITIP